MSKIIRMAFLFLVIMAGNCAFAEDVKDITFKFKNADKVVFSHQQHLSVYNNCRICHNTIYNLKQRKHFTMAEMEQTKSCGACHTGAKAFSVSLDKDCIRCHTGKQRDVTYKVKSAGNVQFSHATHLTKTAGSCKSCHNGKVIPANLKPVKMTEMEKGRTCGACHNGKKAFTVAGNCDRCHKGYKPGNINYKTSAGEAKFSHDSHLQVYKCADCHTKSFPYKAGTLKATMDDMEKGKSCGACHNNGKDAFTVTENCNSCHKNYKPGNITYKTSAGEAKFSHDFHLQAYKCSDCHTKSFPYKAGTLKATMSDMEKGKSCGVCHIKGKDAFSVKDDCDKCHKM
jgi:c(7)-type cytochrome triheme protein